MYNTVSHERYFEKICLKDILQDAFVRIINQRLEQETPESHLNSLSFKARQTVTQRSHGSIGLNAKHTESMTLLEKNAWGKRWHHQLGCSKKCFGFWKAVANPPNRWFLAWVWHSRRPSRSSQRWTEPYCPFCIFLWPFELPPWSTHAFQVASSWSKSENGWKWIMSNHGAGYTTMPKPAVAGLELPGLWLTSQILIRPTAQMDNSGAQDRPSDGLVLGAREEVLSIWAVGHR